MLRVAAIDLDGTLVSCNTFPHWILSIMRSSLVKFDLRVMFLFIGLLAFRKLNFLSHSEFKRRLMMINYSPEYDNIFAKKIIGSLNYNCINRIKSLKVDYMILTTAAPKNYVSSILDFVDIDFDCIHTSYIDGKDLVENYSENKLLNYRSLFNERNFLYFFTDHYEDLPMMLHADYVFLVNPLDYSKSIISKKIENFEII